ncbi:MAG: isocitrate lyase/PEP mutase family protein [Candidatus Methanomethylophilaceae archaeon]
MHPILVVEMSFRDLVEGPDILLMPVAHDVMSAVLAERAGFHAIACAGYANSASLLGRPDVGLLTQTEMVQCAARMVEAVSLPVFADGDTGQGGLLNVSRTVTLFERAGVQALMLEDQAGTKRCGHMDGKDVVSAEEMEGRLRAALQSRQRQDMMIVARTDSRQTHGLDDAVERANRYLDAGADMVFVEAPQSREELESIPRLVKGPVMANMIPGGRTPLCSATELQRMGYSLVAFPTLLTHAMAATAEDLLRELRASGDASKLHPRMMGFGALHEVLGMGGLRAKEEGWGRGPDRPGR